MLFVFRTSNHPMPAFSLAASINKHCWFASGQRKHSHFSERRWEHKSMGLACATPGESFEELEGAWQRGTKRHMISSLCYPLPNARNRWGISSSSALNSGAMCLQVYSLSWNTIQRDKFLSGSWDQSVKLWDLNRPDSIMTFADHAYCVYAVAW